jgi:hypothetical protein
MKDEIALRIQNNTNLPQRISLMGGSQDPNNNANATTLSTWAFSSFAGAARVEIQAKTINQVNYQTYSAPISSPTIQATVESLNSLQIGDFLETSGIIYTSSINNQYRNLALTTATYNFDDFMIQAQAFFDPANSFFTFTGVSFISFYSDTFFNALYKVQGVMDAYFTYGMGVFYPISGNVVASGGSFISITPTVPKPPLSEPITIYDNGVNVVSTAGYGVIPINNVNNVILFAPSGDFLEVSILDIEGIPYYVSNFDAAYWNLTILITIAIGAKITQLYNSGYISSQTAMTNLTIDNTAGGAHPNIIFNDATTFPNISSVSLTNIVLLNQYATYGGLTTANNFGVGFVNNAIDISLGGYGTLASPINFDPSNSNVGFNLSSFQFSDMAINIIDSSFNNYFFNRVNLSGTSFLILASPNYDSQFQDLVTPLDSGNFKSVSINMGLTNFPPIAKIGNQNVGALQYQLTSLDLTLNKFPSAVVNQILIDMDNYITTLLGLGYALIAAPTLDINISGQTPLAPPFGAGIIAKNNLIANGFTVTTD